MTEERDGYGLTPDEHREALRRAIRGDAPADVFAGLGSQRDAGPMTHADALGAYDDTADPMPPDLPDRIIRAQREDFDDRAPARPLSLLRELLGDAPQRQSDFALWPPTRPYGEAGLTVRQGDETPRPPRSTFDWNDYGQRDDAAREAIDRVVAAIIAEDRRARSSGLPPAPDGYEWDGELVTREAGEGVQGEVVVKIVYRLREVKP